MWLSGELKQSEKIWLELGNKTSVHRANWPVFDEELKKMRVLEIPIQVNGKRRFAIQAESGSDQETVEGLVKKTEEYKRYQLEGATKVIFVLDKIINYIV